MRFIFEEGSGGTAGRVPGPPGKRPLARAMGRGARGLCPACSAGPLFAGYLAVAPVCSHCGEAFHHHRADDLPPYLTILLVGHIVVSGLLIGERLYRPDVSLALAFWLPVTAVLTLALLRPIKGAVVALQWALGMHGFAASAPVPPSAPLSTLPPESR